MKHFALPLLGLALSLALLLAACSPKPTASPALPTSPPPARATVTPELPTAVPATAVAPAATATSVPLTPAPATQTPVLSSTLTAVPTPDPNLGVGDTAYEDNFDGASGWLWSYQENEVVAFSVAGSKLNAVMKVGNSFPRLTGGQPERKVGDQQLRVTAVTNLCYAKDEYGVMFRVNPEITDGYLFELNCEGKARVEVLRNYQPTVLVDWTASPAIVPNAPAQNTLMVWAAGNQFHFYVNDRYLFSAIDKTFAEGTYAFYIYDRTAGGASVSFDSLTAKKVTMP
jgi:hypothetical protein